MDASKTMKDVQKWVNQRWQNDSPTTLRSRTVGSKGWWSCIKQHQGFKQDDIIPPLTKPAGTVVLEDREKVELQTKYVSEKIVLQTVRNTAYPAKNDIFESTVSTLPFTYDQVEEQLKLNVSKATGPNNISPHTLTVCHPTRCSTCNSF